MIGKPERRPAGDPNGKIVVALAAAVGGYALAFGAVSATAGMSVGDVALMSIAVNAGGAQFAYVTASMREASGMAAAAAALMVNLRLTLYGTSVQHLFRDGGWRRIAAAHVVGDENVALSTSVHGRDRQRRIFWVAGITFFLVWVVAATLGAWAGSLVGTPEALGLDVAFPAAFVTLLHPMIRNRTTRIVAVVAVVMAVTASPHAPPGIPLMGAGLAGILVSWHLGRQGREDAP